MFTLAAALALAAQEPEASPEDPPVTDLCAAPGEDVAAARADWAIIDARAITNPADLAAALRAAPAGKRRVVLGGSFAGADMRPLAPLLASACMAETELAGTNWEDTEIPNLRLVHIAFTGTRATRVRWPGLSTNGTDWQGADFTGADLTGLRFVSAWQGTDFADTSLRNATLTDASFACGITIDAWCTSGAPDLAGADLTGADISGLWLWDGKNAAGAVLDRTIVAPSALPYLGAAQVAGPLRLADSYTSPYAEEDAAEGLPPYQPTVVEISEREARTLIAATVAEVQTPDSPSFECPQAKSPVEMMICGEYDSGLRALDRDMAAAWAAVRAAGKGDLAAQRRWLAARAECLDDRVCLADRYTVRIAALRGALGPGIALAPGKSVTYADDTLPLPDAMRQGALYERILPVLLEASDQRITLTGNPDGSIAVEGSAVGPNAHTCEMGADQTRFDPATGWWSATSETSGKAVPLFRVEGRQIILRYSGSAFSTPDEAQDFMTCGVRASFTTGTDLSVH